MQAERAGRRKQDSACEKLFYGVPDTIAFGETVHAPLFTQRTLPCTSTDESSPREQAIMQYRNTKQRQSRLRGTGVEHESKCTMYSSLRDGTKILARVLETAAPPAP
uniref:Acetylornithine aminotransferase n=2 Tax=Lygus hesperus TaxID=30085 RepID=A0A0A9WKN1_LYGHE